MVTDQDFFDCHLHEIPLFSLPFSTADDSQPNQTAHEKLLLRNFIVNVHTWRITPTFVAFRVDVLPSELTSDVVFLQSYC